MGNTLDKTKPSETKEPKLRLVKEEQKEVVQKPAPKSALARQLSAFADDLDKQIEAILNS